MMMMMRNVEKSERSKKNIVNCTKLVYSHEISILLLIFSYLVTLKHLDGNQIMRVGMKTFTHGEHDMCERRRNLQFPYKIH
jgi:hypothetical protein